uniref:Putative LPXTG-motif protein cell wall anchor domain protein n=1 Tax=uncultured bacterium Contigcl_1764b TaxID=1393658 RepID=W0FMF5_9BACT|nr:putative LPXTG-motif protein cell wall anchor domain protein [uncultured bacterium Contigcl_1764b]
MQNMKKLIALVLALAMVALCAVASAAKITINRDSTHLEGTGVTDTTEYHYYKIFDAVTPDDFELTDSNIETTKTDAAGFTYSIAKTSSWLATVQNLTDYFKLTEKTDKYLVELVGDATAARAKLIASALLAATTDGSGSIAPDGSLTLGDEKDVANGYYLIATTGQPNLVLATTDVEITEKNDFPSVSKTVAAADKYAQIGKDVTFTVTVTVPADAKLPITLTDEMTEGLDFKAITSVVDKNSTAIPVKTESASGYTYSAGADSQHFTIVFDAATVTANEGGTIVVTYTATVNAKAVVETADVNKVTLTYGNYNQWDTDDLDENSFTIRKYDGSDTKATKTPIGGAIFELKQGTDTVKLIKVSSTEYRVADVDEVANKTLKSHNNSSDTIENGDLVNDILTVDDTVITVKGVDSGLSYTLTEIKAPTGFNANTAAQSLSVNEANTYEFTMENNKGTELPSTGGIGTTIFYILGGLLVVGAAVILVARRKASN